ncbi:hypothetical protein GPECTOR_13g677 [Gonium pectorale]|uniref:Uncharacterized protein n=1 Tax=Gonium pectorale TaxID=33097 RepID=A0A150GPD8_GONPE|nr:hypothetical protein GPECTOR_13g677 [Gonium pectorale]|eukprot:KXZ51190.1 hypothetical protein GPECTOR_13g677 [Gonium pectorale]
MLTFTRSSVLISRPSRASRACALPARRPVAVRAQSGKGDDAQPVDLANGAAVLPVLSALAPLALTAAARADEAATDAAAAAADGGFGAGEVALLVTPVVVYALFNVYRDRINPEAKFLDYIYIMAFLAIVANLVSIAVFKVRFF